MITAISYPHELLRLRPGDPGVPGSAGPLPGPLPGTHPSHEVKKLYHVTLNKPLTNSDFEKIQNGLMLEDGPIEVDLRRLL